MIGRDAELEALQAAYLRLFAGTPAGGGDGGGRRRHRQEPAAVRVRGLERGAARGFYLFRGRATPQTGSQAYGLLRDIMAWRLQIHDDDRSRRARKKMEDGIVPLFVHDDGPDLAEGHAHLLGHLIGIEWKDSRHIQGILDDPADPQPRLPRRGADLRRVGASEGCPVVLQLEDLHWADDESLDFLNHLAEVNRDVPLLVLAFTRPTLFERRADWRSTEGIHQRIDLAPLDKRASRELADELLQEAARGPGRAARAADPQRRGQPLLHGRAGEDADRPGRHRHR
jgi:hypothetical protein